MEIAIQLKEEERRAIALEVIDCLKPLLLPPAEGGTRCAVFDVAGLADYLSVSRDWVYKRVAQREIPYVKAGRAIRFRKSVVDGWMEERAVRPLAVSVVKGA